jgi:uncharacterized membrane protein YgcG
MNRKKTNPFRLNRLQVSFFGLWALTALSEALALPPFLPGTYLYDQTQQFSPTAQKAINALLLEHERATQEQVVIAVLQTSAPGSPRDFFNEWKIGRRSHGQGILLYLDWQARKVELLWGYGFENRLTENQSAHLEKLLHAALRNPLRLEPNLINSLRFLLTNLESPLIKSNRMEKILSEYGFSDDLAHEPTSESSLNLFWILLALISGLLGLSFRVYTATRKDEVFDSRGAVVRDTLVAPLLQALKRFQIESNVPLHLKITSSPLGLRIEPYERKSTENWLKIMKMGSEYCSLVIHRQTRRFSLNIPDSLSSRMEPGILREILHRLQEDLSSTALERAVARAIDALTTELQKTAKP